MTRATLFPSAERSAVFSPCRRYRHTLTRRWDDGPLVCFVCLNPSVADETTNDPTSQRLERRARQWGYAGFVLVNLFDVCATDPKDMLRHPAPISPENDRVILEAARTAAFLVCGWGTLGGHLGRSAAVLAMLRAAGVVPHRLARTKGGEPGHPLFLPYSLMPVAF